jgi:hypothetical protein
MRAIKKAALKKTVMRPTARKKRLGVFIIPKATCVRAFAQEGMYEFAFQFEFNLGFTPWLFACS